MPIKNRIKEASVSLAYLTFSGMFFITNVAAQSPPEGHYLHGYARSPLRVMADESVQHTWKITGADLRENLGSAWGVLNIRNISATAVEEARFYAEYYDRSGRLCMALAFVSESNSVRNTSPVAAGEDRELLALDAGFGPAVEPVVVRVRLVSQRPVGEATIIAAGEDIMHAPVAVASPSDPSLMHLKIDLNSSPPPPPVLDLIFARVFVDAQGRLQETRILNSINDNVRSWFEQFVRQMHFDPATEGSINTSGTSLILVRAIRESIVGVQPAELLSRKSPWVAAWVGGSDAQDVDPVTQILFERSSQIIEIGPGAAQRQSARNAQDPGLFELTFAGAEWSANVLRKAVVDRQTGRGMPVWKSVAEILQ